MAENDIDFESLLLFLKAKSKSEVESMLNSFISIDLMTISVPQFLINKTKQLVDCDNDISVVKLITNSSKLVYMSLKLNPISNETLIQLFPNSFHKQLKALLIRIIIENSSNWLLNVKHTVRSMPSLVEFECKTQSSKCLLDLSLSNNSDKVSVVLSKEQLSDLTQGMAAIRQQLFEATNK